MVSVCVKHYGYLLTYLLTYAENVDEPVWPSGRALLVSRGTTVRIRFGSLFSSKVVVCGHYGFVPHNYRNIKMALIAAHLNAEVILVVTVQRYVYNLPLPPPPPSPSLISLMISVDDKHYVYLLFTTKTILCLSQYYYVNSTGY